MWPLGVHESLAVQTAHPWGGVQQEVCQSSPSKAEVPLCKGLKAILGSSILVLYWGRHVGRYEICATGGKLARVHSLSQWLLPFLQAPHLSYEQRAAVSNFPKVQ